MVKSLFAALQEPVPSFCYLSLREGLENCLEDVLLHSRFSQLLSCSRLQKETETFLETAEDYFHIIPQANRRREELIREITHENYQNCLESEAEVERQGKQFRHSYLILETQFKEKEVTPPETSFQREFDADMFLNDIAFHAYMDRIISSSSYAHDTQRPTLPQSRVRNIHTAPNAIYKAD